MYLCNIYYMTCWYKKLKLSQTIYKEFDVVYLSGLNLYGVITSDEPKIKAGTHFWRLTTSDNIPRVVPEHVLELVTSPKSQELVKDILAGQFKEYKLPLFSPNGEPTGILIADILKNNRFDEDIVKEMLLKRGWKQHFYEDLGNGYKEKL